MDGGHDESTKKVGFEAIKIALLVIRRRWHSWQGLVILIVLAGALATYCVSNFLNDIPTLAKVSVTVVAITLVSIGWAFAIRVPRCSRGAIGIVLAFAYDDESQAKRLRADFIQKLRQQFHSWHSHPPVNIVEFPEWLSEKVVLYNEDQLRQIANKAQCLLLLSGQAKVRLLDSKVHVIEFKGLVRHRPIEADVGRQFAAEFTELLPKSVVSAFKGDFISMAITAEWIDVVARYIVSIAAALSGDHNYSVRQFRELIQQLKEPTNVEFINKIRKRLPVRLAAVLTAQLDRLGNEYTRDRKKECLLEIEQVAAELDRLEPGCYSACISSALVQFSLYRDINKAKEILERCIAIKDAAWMWSKAFLLAYEGDLEASYRMYQLAFPVSSENMRLAVQCEEFIHLVIEEEPDRKQLLFALGLINYRAKGDSEAAKTDLENFVKWAKRESQFVTQVEAAEKWIREIRNQPKARPKSRK